MPRLPPTRKASTTRGARRSRTMAEASASACQSPAHTSLRGSGTAPALRPDQQAGYDDQSPGPRCVPRSRPARCSACALSSRMAVGARGLGRLNSEPVTWRKRCSRTARHDLPLRAAGEGGGALRRGEDQIRVTRRHRLDAHHTGGRRHVGEEVLATGPLHQLAEKASAARWSSAAAPTPEAGPWVCEPV